MKTYNITNRLSAQAKKAIVNAIAQHEKYKNSYFWNPGSSSNWRRSNESKFRQNHPEFVLKKGEQLIEVLPEYSESCNHVYYSMSIYVNDKKKDIRAIKSLLK